MSKGKPKNIPASTRAKLLNISKKIKEDFNFTLTRFAGERLLYRLSLSEYADRFILKGALLYIALGEQRYRPTRDIDFLGFGENSIPALEEAFRKICSIPVEEDGVQFHPDTVKGELIKEDQQYEGVRIKLNASLEQARIPMQIDIGFGDVITPEPITKKMPVMLDFPAPVIKTYPLETWLAENFEAVVKLGMFNSRMKDFYDIWFVKNKLSINVEILRQAITKTFNKRQTEIPSKVPIAFTAEFYRDEAKARMWNSLIENIRFEDEKKSLEEVTKEISDLLMPIITETKSSQNKQQFRRLPMSVNYKRLQSKLEELFQIDKAHLDFGIYRIMNQKRDEISRFLDQDLLKQIKGILEDHISKQVKDEKEELEKTIQTLKEAGVDPDTSTKVRELKNKIKASGDLNQLENEVYSNLYNFFSRYYDGGDFMSLRRYKKDVYAIPYEGEEVKLHWANADQYYIKTSEHFNNYTFRISDSRRVHFRIVDAETDQDNKKSENGKDRRFILLDKDFIRVEENDLHIFFEYKPDPGKTKQEKLNREAAEMVFKAGLSVQWLQVLARAEPTEKRKKRTFLEKQLETYTAKNTFDYFIHKDLGGFLRREMDFYIKNEMLYIDDIEDSDEQQIKSSLGKIKAFRRIAKKIILFLEQLENFQKKMWLKKKFIVETNYCITLDRVPEELYPEIVKNQAQHDEWIRLFAIDEIEPDEQGNPGYSKPLTVEFLKANDKLVLDTRFFDESFKEKLISGIEDVDGQTDGLLIHGENFQALNLLQERFKEQVKCIYIDPPYNTSASEIIYKNSYKNSSWLSLILDRVNLSYQLGKQNTIYCFAIDDFEFSKLEEALNSVFGNYNHLATVCIRSNPHGRAMAAGFSVNHEYALFYQHSFDAVVGRLPRDEKKLARYSGRDDYGLFTWINFRGTGANTRRIDRPKLYYPIYATNEGSLRIPNLTWNEKKQQWIPNKEAEKNEIIIYPIDSNNEERVWTLGWERAKKEANQNLEARFNGGNAQIYRKYRPNQDGALPGTWWHNAKYSATESGTKIIKDLFGLRESFSYPKSINLVEDCVRISVESESDFILDYFAGSGTTGHAVINLNREDGGNRKYILVEVGDYFDTVLKPRIQKVVYSEEWKDGKPVSRNGVSHCFKYIRLESYEDALNNLELRRTQKADELLGKMEAHAREEYLLSYMLDVESRGSESILNLDAFENPFDYRMKITRQNETKETKIDIVETFNYLIGLKVKTFKQNNGIISITGENLEGDKILVLWRNTRETDNDKLNQWFKDYLNNRQNSEFDIAYVNGDNNLEVYRKKNEKWTVKLIEQEFKKMMFAGSEF